MGPLPGSAHYCRGDHAVLCRLQHFASHGDQRTGCRRITLSTPHCSICRGCGMTTPNDLLGEPRASRQLRKLKPYEDRVDLDDDDGDFPPCFEARDRSPSPRRVSFVEEEIRPLRTSSRTRASSGGRRRTPVPASASASLSECCCAPGGASRKQSAAGRTPSSCSCSSASNAKPAEDVEYLYPSRSKSPCPAMARHSCSQASPSPPDPFSFSISSIEGSADSKTGTPKGPCVPPRRLQAEDLVEKRQPSWWEPALSRVLSVLVSTVLLLATGGAQPSAEHLTWTKDFLRCVKDRAGNPPPNVAALLSYLESLEPAASDKPDQASRPDRSPSPDRAERVSRTSRTSRISL